VSDRFPGTTYDNPIWHRGYRIFIDDCAGTRRDGYAFCHDDYDPTPLHSDDGPSDHRHGWERTVDQAKAAIDILEEELAEESAANGQFGVGA
jgi:hypothetical protein